MTHPNKPQKPQKSLPLHTPTTQTEHILSTLINHCSTRLLIRGDRFKNNYRTLSSTPIHLGVLIPDELYDPCLEGLPIETILGSKKLSSHVPDYFHKHKELLYQVQILLNECDYNKVYSLLHSLLVSVQVSKELFAELAAANKGG